MQIKNNIAISENGFMFDPNTGESYSLNPVGVEILNLLKEKKSDKEIIDFLADKYDADKLSIEKSLNEFYSFLQSYKLVEND